MVRAHVCSKMATNTRASLSMVCSTAKASLSGQTAPCTRVSSKTTKLQAKAVIFGPTILNTKVKSSTVSVMALELILTPRKASNTKALGSMECARAKAFYATITALSMKVPGRTVRSGVMAR